MYHSMFPSFVYQDQLMVRPQKLTQELLKECFQFADMDEQGHLWSEKNYPGGFTSYGSLSRLHEQSPTFETLHQHLRKHVGKFAKYLQMDIHPDELKLSALWINIMPQGVTHTMHIHPLSTISGTFYVQTPPGTSAIKFEDPRLVGYMASPPRKAKADDRNQRFISVQPKAGQVVLFESWMRHEVPANPVETPRVSISFNFDWC